MAAGLRHQLLLAHNTGRRLSIPSEEVHTQTTIYAAQNRPGAKIAPPNEKSMQNEIQEKLRRLLAVNQFLDELSVTYLLVECRKLLEHDNSLKANLPTLEFYCNWGLHVQLSRSGAQVFLAKVNPVLTLDGVFNQDQHDALNALLTLDAFRSDLRILLASFGADLSVCDDDARWTSFVHVYSHVVQNSELTLEKTSPGKGPLGLAVKKVTIRPISRIALSREIESVYPMVWIIEYEDGRTGQLELSGLGLSGATVHVFGPTLESVSALHRAQNPTSR